MRKEPTLAQAALLFGASVATVVLGLRLKAGMQLPVLLGVAVAAIGARMLGIRWPKIQAAMFSGVTDGMPAVSILLLVGATIGLWIAGGAIPTMIWYGLKWLNPSTLVPAACILTALVASATGTSFGTIATIGLALMGIGEASGVPAPLLAGAIVSGAYFGDKMSPMSDTTNVAPAVSGATLYEHISSMVATTLPSLLLAVAGFWVLGRTAAPPSTGVEAMLAHRATLESAFRLGPLTLIPVLTLAILSIRKVPAVPALATSLVVSAITVMAVQGMGILPIAKIASDGFVSKTGSPMFDSLLTRGGVMAMMPTVLLIIGATAMGGVLKESGAPERLVKEVLARVKSAGGLVISVISACYLTLLASGNQMLAIILPGQAFKEAFPRRGIHPKVLSRTLEDAGTLGAPLVPWSTASLFIYGVLKVPATAYARYALLNWMVPIVAIGYALTGMFLWKEKNETKEEDVK
ncbi:MAG: Na+/H+ antiporter NhaC [Bacillota bacterium]